MEGKKWASIFLGVTEIENIKLLIQHFLPFWFSFQINFKIGGWVFLYYILSQSWIKRLGKDNGGIKSVNSSLGKEKGLSTGSEKQLQAWREKLTWINQPPEIKETISRKVLVDEGQRQVVEVEQAALWRFLWWSGTITVHVLVDQNKEDHSVRIA